MFQRYLIIFLILCTFGYSSAWAFDGHSVEVGEHSNEHSQEFLLDDEHQNNDDQQNPSCDHHCHAGAHMLGLINLITDLSAPNLYADIALYTFHLNTYQSNPPYHPPLS